MHLRPLPVTAALAVLLLAAGCGGGDDASPAASTKATGQAPTGTPRYTASTVSPATTSASPTGSIASDDGAAMVREALAVSRKDGKRVLVAFGSSWCEDCASLKKLMDASAVSGVLETNYHLVMVDVGKFDKNIALSRKYGNPVTGGIPAVVVLDPDGTVVTTTKNGTFANARSMTAQQVRTFLVRWSK